MIENEGVDRRVDTEMHRKWKVDMEFGERFLGRRRREFGGIMDGVECQLGAFYASLS